jgi:hypothetical protein
MKFLRIITIVAVAALGLSMSQAAYADSIYNLAPNLTADANFTASGGNWDLTMTFTNSSGADTATVNMFTLGLFQPTNDPPPTFTVDTSSIHGWTAFTDSKGDNGTSTCATAGTTKGWLCVGSGALDILPNSDLVFTLSGTYETSGLDPNTLHLISNGLTDSSNSNSKWAISASPVPEPSSITMLLAGLLGLGGIGRRRFLNS